MGNGGNTGWRHHNKEGMMYELTIQESGIATDDLLKNEELDLTSFIELTELEQSLSSTFQEQEGILQDMCLHMLHSGGKRIRPLLLMFTGGMFTRSNDTLLLKAGTAAELIHMASLVHDDIIDCSPTRRSKPSVNHLWGDHFAVLCGDFLFAKAFELLSEGELVTCMACMVEAIQNMCSGEIHQASQRFNVDRSLENYYSIIEEKTAIFLACCCKAGAILGKAKEPQLHLAYQYGLNLGYAFQIIDDILDLFGDPETMGKPIGEDLKQGNLTLPLLLLLNHGIYRDPIKKLILEKDFSEDSFGEIKHILEQTRMVEKSYAIARGYLKKAQRTLMMLPKCRYNGILFALADMLLSRAN